MGHDSGKFLTFSHPHSVYESVFLNAKESNFMTPVVHVHSKHYVSCHSVMELVIADIVQGEFGKILILAEVDSEVHPSIFNTQLE